MISWADAGGVFSPIQIVVPLSLVKEYSPGCSDSDGLLEIGFEAMELMTIGFELEARPMLPVLVTVTVPVAKTVSVTGDAGAFT